MISRCAFVALLCLVPASALAAQFPCDEPGVLAAIAAGGGPHTFACGGPTTVVTSAELVVSQSVELDGGGLLTLSGAGAHAVMSTTAGTSVTLRNLAFRDAVAGNFGACIEALGQLTLDSVEVSGCEAPSGAAVFGWEELTLTDSDIHHNVGFGVAGGIGQLTIARCRIHHNAGGAVGGGSPTFITESTITRNTGDLDAGIVVGGESYVVISRSTVSHNVAKNPNGSGGLGVHAFAAVDDSTFVGNRPVAIRAYQWGPPAQAESVTIRSSTLVGGYTIVVDPQPPPAPHVKGVYATFENTLLVGGGGGMIIARGVNMYVPPDATECAGVTNPALVCVPKNEMNLGKLGDHGGPTWTVPLLVPSAAVDASVGCTSTTDQRGVARPHGAACDIGAFEWNGGEPVPALPPVGVALLAAALLALGARRR